ncbi:MAG: acetyl-CoA carboxylase biotin carboxylase subunit [Gemmatimonadetes bacterium]|nr:acetyl-CoA carboxylase biotin carboxylase subunit [Gemmatimonadota bacterium]
MFQKLLIANRGEIAVRVIRACHELGVEVVAVYSEADRLSPHVLEADEAYLIGPPPSAESYLCADKLIATAKATGCQAIHPGYGFLAERAHFAEAVERGGLVFIGPPAGAIAAMGDKTEARRRMRAAGVPVVPGTLEVVPDPARAAAGAAELGYPVLLKAAAGGGGKGMRVVRSADELVRAFEAATRESQGAFGDGSIYLEKYLDGPRHIEIQVLADARGRILHLGERECSIQRRHQKLIEEAPSPALTPELRRRMGEAAVAAAAAVGYRNAGTIEFLFHDGRFHFLEMNTRIQVEHPVTELVTGIDLVQWQIRIAAGEHLAFGQDDVRLSGHAMECRITSEDALNGFLPSTGRIELLEVPSGPGVRWDGGIAEGFDVSLFYDPLLGKLIVHAPDRATAIERMRRALGELRIIGIESSVPFHQRVMEESDFRAGRIDIGYLEHHPDLLVPRPDEEVLRTMAVAAVLLEREARERSGIRRIAPAGGSWRIDRGWRGPVLRDWSAGPPRGGAPRRSPAPGLTGEGKRLEGSP